MNNEHNFPEVNLCPLTDDDIAIMKVWLNKDHIRKWYEEPESWLHEINERNREFSFIHHFIVKSQKMPFGFCQYYKCADSDEEVYRPFPKEGTYSIDYLIGEEDFLGKGFGKAVVNELVKVIFQLPDSKIIVVQPETENTKSCNTLKANGFLFDDKNQVYYKNKLIT
jgi:RimJ/RimL family protein N-acetyltransferase